MTKETKAGLKGFKIGDAVKKPVSPTSAAQMKKQAEEAAPTTAGQSAGFPHLEAWIEKPTLDKSGLHARVEQLTGMTTHGDPKTKAAARKAVLAYEHVERLLDFLWATKEQLAGVAPAAVSPGKASKPTPPKAPPKGGKAPAKPPSKGKR